MIKRDQELPEMTLEQNAREAFTLWLPPDKRSPKTPDENQDAGDCITLRAGLKFELKLLGGPGMGEILLDISLFLFSIFLRIIAKME